ncbi:hypothetical protein Agabi119p4_6836 [Agaricus bisporus var. burnettii]|uniref:DUF6534 domain-containing protein n=1 Tax=Agaricus bisporus var. burnettii TaxID=192524 RepID=A0A8H7F0A0_AGABI|nr:hypothetical protein Agabi119p4_6836 [Agaricus bisporus var. burnettii]
MSSQTQPISPAILFGVVFDLLLFGILTGQAYVYYISFPRDRTLLKGAVIWVYLAGAAQIGLVLLDVCTRYDVHEASTYKFQDYYNVNSFFYTNHDTITITVLTTAVAVVIQSLYAYRIYLMSKKRWLTIMIICMSLCQLASGILGGVCYAPLTAGSVFTIYNIQFKIGGVCEAGFVWIWGPVNIICDLTITVCMVTFLIKHRKRTVSHRTRLHITKIVQIVIETGMATTILLVAYTALRLIRFEYIPEEYIHWYILPGLMMSKVYSNSMLVLLNNRATIVNGRHAMESFEFIEVSG